MCYYYRRSDGHGRTRVDIRSSNEIRRTENNEKITVKLVEIKLAEPAPGMLTDDQVRDMH